MANNIGIPNHTSPDWVVGDNSITDVEQMPGTAGTIMCHNNKFKAHVKKHVYFTCNEVVRKCVKEHEEYHIKQIQQHQPKLCEGKENGSEIGFASEARSVRWELPAYQETKKCLTMERSKAGADTKCINSAITAYDNVIQKIKAKKFVPITDKF